MYLLSKAESSCGLAEESRSVRVERLVDGRSARLGACKGNTGRSSLLCSLGSLVASELADQELHAELDEIQRDCKIDKITSQKLNISVKKSVEIRTEPYNVPHPNDTDPCTRNTSDGSEAPVGVSGNDRRDDLGDNEGTHESERGSLHEEEAMRTSNEDKSL